MLPLLPSSKSAFQSTCIALLGCIGLSLSLFWSGAAAIASGLPLNVELLATDALTSNAAIADAGLAKTELVVYRTPTCGCCGAWVERMQAKGFQIQDHVIDDVDAIKVQNGLPERLESCHTALIDGYVVEGHVPAEDIQRLLREKPDVLGISAPGMPVGSPGMESDDDTAKPYATITFDRMGNLALFAEHGT